MTHIRKYLAFSLLTVAVVAALGAASWWVWNRYFSPQVQPSAQTYPLRGIDLSGHNGEVDFASLDTAQVQFLYVKATEGTDFADRQYLANLRGAAQRGIAVGAYHFFRFDTDGEMQALNFLHALRYRRLALPPAIDIEAFGNPDGMATARIVDNLRDMLTLLEAEGCRPLLYTNKDGYERFIRGNFDRYPLWICSFSDPPLDGPGAPQPLIWQYTHRGSVDGVSGSVDLDAATADFFKK